MIRFEEPVVFDEVVVEYFKEQWSVILVDGAILDCTDEEEAMNTWSMFGGQMITRNVYYGDWYAVQAEGTHGVEPDLSG